MGLQQSKDELLYQQVSNGNSESIKSLRNEGAGLEWIDKEGKTPLILACMNPELHNVCKTLIELGANVNAYRPGRHAGTPLHHAAKRGLEQMVKLLLSHGANALVMNDDCQTPLDVARVRGHTNVVRAIENHLCLFSGWLQELYGPGFLELLAPQLLSRKVWVVILPCGARRPSKPFKLELVIYSSLQDAKPRTIIALWKANMEEPNFSQPDPSVIISSTNIPRRWRRKRGILTSQVRQSRVKLAPVNEREKQQLQRFCEACKGIPQVTHPAFPFNNQGSGVGPAAQSTEDTDLALAISASLQSSSQIRPTPPDLYQGSGSMSHGETTAHNGKNQYVIHDTGSSTSAGLTNPTSHNGGKSQYLVHDVGTSGTSSVPTNPITHTTPSAPPIPDMIEEEGPVQYPSIDSTPVDLTSSVEETVCAKAGETVNDNADSSMCVICLDAPIEGACIPCGHMAGCMSCLNEIKGKKWGCPVCRTKIDQVVRLYAV